MADTGLHDFRDLKTAVWTLPLSHTGVFGEGLEKKLKDRQELNKQICVLLPEVSRKRRSFFFSETHSKPWKWPWFNDEKPYSHNRGSPSTIAVPLTQIQDVYLQKRLYQHR